MLEFPGKISKRDKAQAAMFLKNSENKEVDARKHVEQLKERRENSVSTSCLIYNATGDTINFSHSKNWEGQFGSEYPEMIENGQWGVLVHVSSRTTSPRSSGAVVYRGKNEDEVERDWMLAWDNISGKFCSHKVN
ncbi:hypothetical protein SLEP1_g50858 [Rubroshorea leprosula]|uniref:23 kDa jasmonate-induced protein-like n=1 Tax=Rubroshorea leprosula TaxID=152421 RepID=A0AAV5M1F4_9ROSI|nr:hypothetical protein SLEP1_g50858 [Rubroshorea leprosula]